MRTTRWMIGAAALLGATAAAGCGEDVLDLGAPRSCSIPDQNEWVYAAMGELYLWSSEMPSVDPLDYESPKDLVKALRVDPDRWSRVSDKATSDALFEEGKTIGLGFRTKRDLFDNVIVASVHEKSPAGLAGMRRGDRFQAVAGFTIAQLDEDDSWGDVYGENVPGVSVPFTLDHAGEEVELVLTKDWYEIVTVPTYLVVDVGSRRVGYVFFQTFVEPSIEALDTAFAEFNREGVTDVVIDVRYNGGGLINVSRHLTDLLIGNVASGKVSYQTRYNDNLSELSTSRDVEPVEHSLPNVGTVAFLTTGTSLSATELLINAVRAHTHVEVVGEISGGKPVGSKHVDFCDSVLAPITFHLLNADGEGDYFDGIEPTCAAADDLSRQLGDVREGSFAAALSMIGGNGCPEIPAPIEGPRAPERAPAPSGDVMPELRDWH